MFSRLLGRNSSKEPDKPKDIQNNQPQLQRSNASANVLQLTKSPEEQRGDALEQARGNHTPLIAQQLYQSLIANAETASREFLDTDKKALALRDELQKAANAKVEDMIDTTDGYTEEEKADAKKHAIHAAAKADHIKDILHTYARDTVIAETPVTHRDSIQAKTDEGWKTVKPKTSLDINMQTAEAKKQALKLGTAETKLKLGTVTDGLKNKLALAITQNAKLLNSKVEDTEGLRNATTQELEQRHTLDASLVEDSVIDTVYQNKLESPIQSAALMKLGVGRGAWRRSKELNTYRQSMKDSGRDFAAADIATEIGSNAKTNQNDVSKKYFEMMAKAEAYVLAKGSLDSVMENEAKEITKRVIPAEDTKKQLKTAAQSAAYNIARTDQTKVDKIREAARNAATTKAIEILKVKQTEAVKAARMITKGDKETNAGPDQTKRDTLNTNLQKQVKDDEIGKKAVTNVVAAQNMTSALDRVGSIINMAVPNTGDSSSLEFELKIPIAQSGAYILIGLAAEAERDSEKELAASAQLTFGAGFTTFGLDANFRAGFLLEAQGKDSKSLSNLLSYGMYRQMRKVSTTAAESLWGQGGKSGLSKTDEAELWAAMVEESYMTDDNYVDVGMIAKIAADLNVGIAKFSGEAGYKRLTHYDRETLQEKTQQGMGNTTQFANLAKKAEELGFGANKHVIEAAAGAEFKIGGNDVAFGVEGSGTWLNGKFRELELSASGSIPFTFGEDTAEWVKIASKIVTPAVGAGKNVIGIIAGKAKGDKEFGSKAMGNTADLGSSIMMTIPQFESAGKSLAEMIQGDETVNDTMRELLTGDGGSSAIETVNKIALSSSLDVAITFSKEWDKTGAPDEWEIDLEVKQTKGFEVDAEIVKVGVEKSSRLGKIGFGKDENGAYGLKSASLLGFDKS